MTIILWLTTLAAIVGTVGVTMKRRWGMGVWVVTDAVFAWHNAAIGQWAQMALWVVYLGIAVWGVVRWKNTVGSRQTAVGSVERSE